MGVSWLSLAGYFLRSVPIERWLFPPPDRVKALERFAAGLDKSAGMGLSSSKMTSP